MNPYSGRYRVFYRVFIMTIYIANTTKQTIQHSFRAPESDRTQMIEIPSGQQSEIGQNWNSHQTDIVVKHLEIFGARNINALKGSLKDYSGMLYSTNKPITTEQIEGGHEAVLEHQQNRSVAEVTKNALAFDNVTQKNGKGQRLASETEVTVKQDIAPKTKRTGKEVDFSLSVSEQGNPNARLPV